jgi:hypothetical protein
MATLPRTTRPPAEPIRRRHEPKPGAYVTFRPCLRWEFGFTCAFCLLHEADLAEHGVAGMGLMTIEHHITRSADPTYEDDYANCFYACRFCNGARGRKCTEDARGRRLLHPCRDAWGEHFMAEGERLPYAEGDVDAEYTHAAYRLDAPMKQVMRSHRRESIDASLQTIDKAPSRLKRLTDLAERLEGEERELAMSLVVEIHAERRRARRQLDRYSLVPKDCDAICRCAEPPEELAPPSYIVAQTTASQSVR